MSERHGDFVAGGVGGAVQLGTAKGTKPRPRHLNSHMPAWMRTLQAAVARTLFEQVNWPLHKEQNAGGPAPCARVPHDSDDALLFFIVRLSSAGIRSLRDRGCGGGPLLHWLSCAGADIMCLLCIVYVNYTILL
jgi:hypothetical protein